MSGEYGVGVVGVFLQVAEMTITLKRKIAFFIARPYRNSNFTLRVCQHLTLDLLDGITRPTENEKTL
jgi:hypothetical protein